MSLRDDLSRGLYHGMGLAPVAPATSRRADASEGRAPVQRVDSLNGQVSSSSIRRWRQVVAAWRKLAVASRSREVVAWDEPGRGCWHRGERSRRGARCGGRSYVPSSGHCPFNGLARPDTRDPETLRVRIERALQQASGGMPVTTVGTMDSLMHESTARSAFRMWLMSAFAVIALLLAAVGVYGVMTYAVRHQAREIGIRIAIGAKPRDITRMVVMTQLGYSLAGLAGGIGCAVWMTRLLRAFLFGVAPGDPASFVSAVIVLVVVAAASAWIPARRAARTDPLIALRTS